MQNTKDDEVRAAVTAIARQARSKEPSGPGRDIVFLEELPLTDEELARKDRSQDITLKRVYAYRLLTALLVQLFIADGVFVAYAQFGKH